MKLYVSSMFSDTTVATNLIRISFKEEWQFSLFSFYLHPQEQAHVKFYIKTILSLKGFGTMYLNVFNCLDKLSLLNFKTYQQLCSKCTSKGTWWGTYIWYIIYYYILTASVDSS